MKPNHFIWREITVLFRPYIQVSMECRSQSLRSHGSDQPLKASIELHLSVLKSEEHCGSSSLHVSCHSPSASHCPSPSIESRHCDGTLERTTGLSLDETKNPHIRRTVTQPTISWMPLTNEQIGNLASVTSILAPLFIA